MADTPTGTGLSELDGVAALAKLRQARSQNDKPKTEADTDAADTDTEVAATTAETEEETGAARADTGADADAEAEQSDDNETQDNSGEPEAEAVIIKLPNGEQVSAEEAAKGYLRQSDYTRKTQEVADMRRTIERERGEVLPKLAKLVSDMEAAAEKEPNWQELAQSLDPWEFQKRKAEYDAKTATRTAARAQLDAYQKAQLAQAQHLAREALSRGDFETSWKTPDGLKKGMEQIAAWAIDQGFPSEVLQSITDPSVIVTLEKARRYDESRKTKTEALKVVKDKPKPIKPGAKPTASTAHRETQQLKNRFAQTKTQDDGMALLRKLRESAA